MVPATTSIGATCRRAAKSSATTRRSSGRSPTCCAGDYKQSEYGRVILPLTVLRRLDCVLEPTKQKVLEQAARYGDRAEHRADPDRGVGRAVLQHLPARLHDAARRPRRPRRQPPPLHRQLLDRRPRRARQVRLRQPDRPARPLQPALPGRVEVRRDRPAPPGRLQPGDGLPLRGARSGGSPSCRTRPPGSTSPPARSSG